ncbi:phage tail tape measure protein [Marinobacter nauticus]|uniref:phage tail tape measure protein n=1 Tax=Marinobacter nauticus TaxID=2743 RepID=UPI000F2B52D4|nr:phage tail tape measure protein [Marinobacter nauticus]RKR79164.1 TP901 family phage tail tape measure protein [Marinobacter nauticus]
MADLKKTVELIFGGVDKTGPAITSVGRNLDALADKTGNITGPLASAADSILKLQTSLVALGAAALTFAAKEAVSFEAALIDLQKVMGDNEGAAADYADTFSNLSTRFGVDAGAIVQSTADFRQAGFDINDSLTLVEQSLLAVNAADLTTQQSADLLIGTLAGFKAPAADAANLLDVLNAVSNNAGASVAQLGDGFKVLAPVAKTLGLSFEETAALLTPVVEVTRSGSESANALKTAISNLIKPTKERKELLEDELGIQLEIDGQRRNTKDVLYDLIEATQSLDDNEKQRVATVIAGAEQMSRFLAVLNGAERSEEILKVAMEASGSTLQEFEVRTQSAEFALNQLRAAFTTAAKVTGMEYIDETKAATQATTNLVKAFQQALQGDNADKLFDALRGGLERFSEQVNIIAENLPEAFEGLDFSQLLTAFDGLGDELGDSFSAVFGDIDLSTVDGLQQALQKVVDAFTALTNVSTGIISGLQPLFSAIGAGIEEFQDLDSATQQTVGELLGLSKAIDTVLPLLGGLGSGLESIGTGLTALAGAQGFKALIGNLNSVKSIAAGAGQYGLVGLALLGAGGIGYGIGSVINGIIGEIEDALGVSIGGALYEYLNAEEIAIAKGEWEGYASELRRTSQDAADLREISEFLNQALEKTTVATSAQQSEWQAYADELVRAAQSGEDVAESQRKVTTAVDELQRTARDSGGALGEVSRTTKELSDNNKSLQLGYDKATGKVNSFSGTIVKSGKSVEEAAKKTEKLVEKSEDYYVAMEKIASNERIKNVEAKVSLDIAEVEANAKQVEALLDTIGKTFENTGTVISNLFGGFDNASRSTQIDLARQIRQENEYRQQALDDQSKLTQAQVDLIREKIRKISRGESAITVNAPGLQPHLEAIWYQILGQLQVKVNAEGEEMLLGLNQ